MYFIYKCPKCAEPLKATNSQTNRIFACANNHTFDIAKEGYVNLHLVEKKNSKNPGDDTEMMKSRQAFLNCGYYGFLASALSQIIKGIATDAPLNLLDIGCGEGYYLSEVSKQFESPHLAGIDISKSGIRLAAKRKFGSQLAVASAFDLPFFNHTFNIALSIFAPICPRESARILKPGGHLIMVGPGPKHLEGLVKHIYTKSVAHEDNFNKVTEDAQFSLVHTQIIDSTTTIDATNIPHLLRMTPYYWHATPEQQKILSELSELTTQIQFEISVYRANNC